MSRKDSLILLSNNPEKNKNMKVLDDEGEEIEIEYVDERKLNNNFFMQIIKEQEKEDIDMLIKEKMLKTDLFEQDDDYYVLKFNPEPKKNNYIEKILMKINEMKNQKIRKVEKMKNLKEEMNEIKKFYFSLIKEEKSDN